MKQPQLTGRVPSSFRDRSGYLFYEQGQLYRQINCIYRQHYELLMKSGLYDSLIEDGLLIPHKEVSPKLKQNDESYKTIQPERLPFISYPYEWCFSQLKNAALTTLNIQMKALEFGMSLKDASAYNIQFKGFKPLLIDTLSFQKYKEGRPWVAYRQFCQHFIAPLAIAAFCDIKALRLLRTFIDGHSAGLGCLPSSQKNLAEALVTQPYSPPFQITTEVRPRQIR